jgi:hypothetical protein
MVLPHVNYIQPMDNNVNNPGEPKPDICYLPASTIQSLPPPPPYSRLTPAPTIQPHMYSPSLAFITQMQTPHQGVLVPGNFIFSQTAHIRDYMVWSIANVFLGGFLLGFILVYLSMQTKKLKQEGDVKRARTMSRITLIGNISITILFFILTAFVIIYFLYFLSIRNLIE